MFNIFIDGQAGTTGLLISKRLKSVPEINLLEVKSEDRKNPTIKKDLMNKADVVILCLPDQAAKESVKLIDNPKTKILDASSAHRVNSDWVYGLPELGELQREKIKSAKKVSNPGCYATGFILLAAPLRNNGIIDENFSFTVQGVSGYSGGGRQMIEKYQAKRQEKDKSWSYRPYALDLNHKHLAEMTKHSGLKQPPIFIPAVADLDQGMIIMVPLNIKDLNISSLKNLWELFNNTYKYENFIEVMKFNDQNQLDDNMMIIDNLKGSNYAQISIFGNKNQALLIAKLDNLGKGASGAAVQNLNLMLGLNEDYKIQKEEVFIL